MKWMCSFPEPFILLCDCLEWITSWLICTLSLIQNHEILTFIPPKANFLERVILRAMIPLLNPGQDLETFPPLYYLLAMGHRAQLLSDREHSFFFQRVQRLRTLSTSSFCLGRGQLYSHERLFGISCLSVSKWPGIPNREFEFRVSRTPSAKKTLRTPSAKKTLKSFQNAIPAFKISVVCWWLIMQTTTAVRIWDYATVAESWPRARLRLQVQMFMLRVKTLSADQKLSCATIVLTSSERRRISPVSSDFSEGRITSDSIGGSEGITWEQRKSHHFVNAADTARERLHRHKSMLHVRPIWISKPELWILW